MAYPGDEDHYPRADEGIAKPSESWEEEEQLALADGDERLPWLEADDYEDEPGFDWRLVIYAIVGLLVVGLLLAAIWWFTRDTSDPELLPEGSTIQAPEGAYKQRPEDPGGKQVEGTGDQAFEVAEGQSTRAVLAEDQPAPPAPPAADNDQDETDTPAQGGNAVYVQIGAYGNRADADGAWTTAVGRFEVLSGMPHRVVEAQVNGATVYRLQAIAGDRDTADATCRAIRNSGGDCYIR